MSKFITFEGTEGVGKTTVINGVCEYLDKQGTPFVRTREPGGSEVGELLREIFLDASRQLSVNSELLMIFAARSDHLDKVILPALAKGQWVICDRFLDSTIAYQGFGRWGGCADSLDKIHLLANTFIDRLPDVSFWLDLDVKIGLERAGKRGSLDRLEQETLPFFERTYQGFCHQYQNSDGRLHRINADQSPEAVLDDVLAVLGKN